MPSGRQERSGEFNNGYRSADEKILAYSILGGAVLGAAFVAYDIGRLSPWSILGAIGGAAVSGGATRFLTK